MEQKIEFNHGKFLGTIGMQLFICVLLIYTLFMSDQNVANQTSSLLGIINICLLVVFGLHTILTAGQYMYRVYKGYGCFSIAASGLEHVYYDTGNVFPIISPSTNLLPWNAIIRFEMATFSAGRVGHRSVIYVEVDPSYLADDTPTGFRRIIKQRNTALIDGDYLGVGFYLDTHAVDDTPFALLAQLNGALSQNKS